MKRNKINNNNNSVLINNKRSKLILISKDSNLHLSHLSQSSLPNIAIKKDERLEALEISKGLSEVLQDAVFTIEKILDYGSSYIAEVLGIDAYIAELIYKETQKATSTIDPNFLIN